MNGGPWTVDLNRVGPDAVRLYQAAERPWLEVFRRQDGLDYRGWALALDRDPLSMVQMDLPLRAWYVQAYCAAFTQWANAMPGRFYARLQTYSTLGEWAGEEAAGVHVELDPLEVLALVAPTTVQERIEGLLASAIRRHVFPGRPNVPQAGVDYSIALTKLQLMVYRLTPYQAWSGLGREGRAKARANAERAWRELERVNPEQDRNDPLLAWPFERQRRAGRRLLALSAAAAAHIETRAARGVGSKGENLTALGWWQARAHALLASLRTRERAVEHRCGLLFLRPSKN